MYLSIAFSFAVLEEISEASDYLDPLLFEKLATVRNFDYAFTNGLLR